MDFSYKVEAGDLLYALYRIVDARVFLTPVVKNTLEGSIQQSLQILYSNFF